MSETRVTASDAVEDRDNTRLYAGVILVEVIVVVGIWLIQRYFGS